MAFDDKTRNKLAHLVGDARTLLVTEFTEQLQELYGIQPDGAIADLSTLTHLDDEQLATAARLRERIDHLASGFVTEKKPVVAGIDRALREQAFTILNRFAALRMCEERGLLHECVGNGFNSKGFKVYQQVAGAGLGDIYHRYRAFIFVLFDELAVDLGVLFDRFSPFGLLFPREQALLGLLEVLNQQELKHIWAEDETVGWVYQYFNPPDERKAMREASAAPRNSRELAVRNQFFTPRYVVEFLSDNTLGRIWYEMAKGDTRLKDLCRYLVRRPSEIFLTDGETAPNQEQGNKQQELSQAELLRQPVHIPHRPLKDPRTIRMLDPACGSMHFGLYCFDLYEVIYDEAWDIEERLGVQALTREPGMSSLHETFASKEDFLRQIPRQIIKHNIHGIDIDPRCAQIAGLSLWLRAQKTWQTQRLKPTDRPRITKSNIVCAEPMPGRKELLREFTATLPHKAIGQLVEVVFDKMQLAGEAGSLLKIEEEIRDAISEARKQWRTGSKAEQGLLFSETAKPKQGELQIDTSGITDELFWEKAEGNIYKALAQYAEATQNGHAFARRLFAEDAARGFAFIDVCRKRYDVALMNPPFGSPAESFEDRKEHYPNSGRDIYAMFVERMSAIISKHGLVGAILPRTGLFIGTMVNLRKECYLRSAPLRLLADLGKDVLDGATIRTACYVIGEVDNSTVPCLRIGNIDDREHKLLRILEALCSGLCHEDLFLRRRGYFLALPASAIAYWIPEAIAKRLSAIGTMTSMADIRQGIATGDNFRFLRLGCELPTGRTGFCYYSKGGAPVPFISDESLYVRAFDACAEMKANAAQEYGSASRTIKNEETFGLPGITYSQVNDACLKFRIHPAGAIYDMKGPVLFPRAGVDRKALLGFLNSAAVEDFMRMMTDGRQWHVSALKSVPAPAFTKEKSERLCQLCVDASRLRLVDCASDETGHYFSFTQFARVLGVDQVALDRVLNDIEDEVWDSFGASRDEVASFQRQRLLFLERTMQAPESQEQNVSEIVKLALGFAFGRWDIRYATGKKPAPELPDPFAPLPICPPGMLQSVQGLPAGSEDVPAAYPIGIPWDGILVDDPNHPLDIERRVREVIEVIWKDRADATEREACEILGVKSLRDYFRRPTGFFAEHLKRYSKSRRQAPIYWPLSTASGSYTLWVYYPRLTDQTLFTCVKDFVDPKLAGVTKDIARLRSQQSTDHRPQASNQLEELVALEQELREFRDEFLRLTKLPYKPDLNDGVMISACPLWKLFRLPKWQKDLKACWEALADGDYNWAHLAYAIWPDRVTEKCKTDRSLAIAHGLENLCSVEPPKSKTKKSKKSISPAEDVQMEVDI